MMLKKIKSAQEIEKKRQRNQIVVGVVIIVLLVISTAGYAFLNNDSSSNGIVKVNGLTFVRNGDFWKLNVQGKDFYFTYLPNETLENVSGNFSFSDYYGKPLYYNDANLGTQEILTNLNGYLERAQQACTSQCAEWPVKTCNDSFIIFQSGNDSVLKQEGCVYISGDSVKGADAFLYRIFGIN